MSINDEAKEKLLEQIDKVTEPEKMNKKNALEFLEELISDIEIRCEALRDELGE